MELPFSIFRKPGEKKITAIFQSDARLNTITEFNEKGFVFAPFNLEEGMLLIKADEILTTSFEQKNPSKKNTPDIAKENKDTHIDLVTKGIHEIKKGRLKKVVLSRKIEIETSFAPEKRFAKLLSHYPNAFCYLLYHPKVGTWCGATPETLVRIKEGHLQTMSLASTLPYEENEEPKWGEKEIEEQKMVSDYIQEKLGPLMHSLHISKPESVKAGNLWHLKSEIKGEILPGLDFREVVASLHPTPAICGIPTQEAKEFILKNENYKRSFYTGFLGELNLHSANQISLFVNLRCMELHTDSVSIFVGGGITADSDPESEWIETQNKSRTMMDIL